MASLFPLAPRYRLNDESPWLEGIDPLRHYWIRVNGEASLTVVLSGLSVSSLEEFKVTLSKFRSLQSGDSMPLVNMAGHSSVYCVSSNCYAIEADVQGALVWHLFDHETLDSLLMTAHPDWHCAPQDLELGRKLLARAWEQSIAA
jgi:hypothetical protein